MKGNNIPTLGVVLFLCFVFYSCMGCDSIIAAELVQVRLKERSASNLSPVMASLSATLEVKENQSVDQAIEFRITIPNNSPEEAIVVNPLDTLMVTINIDGVGPVSLQNTPRMLVNSGSRNDFPPRSFYAVEIRSDGTVRTKQDSNSEMIRISGNTDYQVTIRVNRIKKYPRVDGSREWKKVAPGGYNVRVSFLAGKKGFRSETFKVKVNS